MHGRELTVVVAYMVVACHRPSAQADPVRIPGGHGWYASTIQLGTCTRSCETRPGAMTASGDAPVQPCAPVATAYCYTFKGPENAGSPVRCLCDAQTCENNRKSVQSTDYGSRVTDVSECTAEP